MWSSANMENHTLQHKKAVFHDMKDDVCKFVKIA